MEQQRGFCAHPQAAQLRFFSMIGEIDGVTSQYNCFDFNANKTCSGAQANCAFHNGGCKAALDSFRSGAADGWRRLTCL